MAKSQASSAVCPCRVSEDQKLSYSDCCEPLIRAKQKADTAESLMRARYTAFAKHEIDFILTSHHSKTRGEVNREEIEDWARNSEWLGLKIVQVEAGKASDNQGVIIFHAEYNAPDSNPAAKGAIKHHDHWERSLFEKEGGEWKFLDAQGIQQGPIRRSEPKIGRNDACPCGSGKKYKKCHA